MLDRDVLRVAMRQWATGVTVVSSLYEGMQHGMTVNSFTSISLDPPLLLVSLSRVTRTHHLVEKAGLFGVTILSAAQMDISNRFAGRIAEDQDRFAGLETFALVSGALFLKGGLAFFDCQVVGAYPLADHTLFIGEVKALRAGVDGAPLKSSPAEFMPLIYYNRDYRLLCEGHPPDGD
jgi:flavin reductase (DIM6/NTAB) family NADH-FMN oxidoreductase RutF